MNALSIVILAAIGAALFLVAGFLVFLGWIARESEEASEILPGKDFK